MIEIKETSFRYGEGESHGDIKNIDLQIKKGECILLCGRSGCGKTSVTRLINGLIPDYFTGEFWGVVTVDGRDTLKIPMYQMAQTVGSVFQNPRTQFFYTDTDGEILFGCENQGMSQKELKTRLSRTMDELKLYTLSGRNLFALSGGEKQKIAFASVYAGNPEIFLLDEPSSNLDLGSIAALKQYLALVKEQGKTIVIAEHRLYYLMELADRIVYMDEGKIQDIWKREEFLSMPQAKRSGMGLRAISLDEVHPMQKERIRQSEVKVLEIRNVTLYRKKRRILGELSFSAGRGEIIAITGNNGCGKTTFLRTLCGLHKDCTGDFLWNGKVENEKRRRKRSYMVMQDVNYQLFAESVETEVCFGMKNVSKELAERTLKELNLWNKRKHHPNTLSGGEKQRLAVAVSMICEKEVLVFDEPTSGLDYDSMCRVAELLKKVSENKIIFVVTHDYEFICQACTRVLHFEDETLGQDILVDGKQEQILRKNIER